MAGCGRANKDAQSIKVLTRVDKGTRVIHDKDCKKKVKEDTEDELVKNVTLPHRRTSPLYFYSTLPHPTLPSILSTSLSTAYLFIHLPKKSVFSLCP